MASLNWNGAAKRHTAGDAKAAMRHDAKDKRMEHSHSNEDIDKTRTPLNTDVTGMTYEEACKVYDRKMEEYKEKSVRRVKDKETGEQKIVHMPIRKDAVTFLDLTLSTPRDLPPEKEDQWFADVRDVINKHYKADVCLDIKIHRDEIHTYTDPETKQRVTSRAHGHCWVMPEIDGKLNAKRFCSRGNITHINYEIDAMTREKYRCMFLTGDKSKNRGYQTAEQLKRRSDEAQRQAEAEMNFINDHEKYADILAEDLNAIQGKTERNNELRQQNDELKQQAAAEQRNIDEIRRQIVAEQQTLNNLRRQEKDKQAKAKRDAGITFEVNPEEVDNELARYKKTLGGDFKVPEEDLRNLLSLAAAHGSIEKHCEAAEEAIYYEETERVKAIAAERDEAQQKEAKAQREAAEAQREKNDLSRFIDELTAYGPLAGRKRLVDRWKEKYLAVVARDSEGRALNGYMALAKAEHDYNSFLEENGLNRSHSISQRDRSRDRGDDLER